MAKHAHTTRRALFAAATVFPLAAAPAIAAPAPTAAFEVVLARHEAAKSDAIAKFWATPADKRPATYTLNPTYQRQRGALWDIKPACVEELEKKWAALAGERFAGLPEFIIADLKAMIAAGSI